MCAQLLSELSEPGTVYTYLTLFALGRGTMCPHRNNCPQNTEKRKKFFLKSTNLEGDANLHHPPRNRAKFAVFKLSYTIENIRHMHRR